MAWIQKLKMRFRRDPGIVLVEAVVAMGIFGFVLASFATVSTSSSQIQTTAISHGVAIQAAQGVVEQARSAAWGKVAVKAAPAAGSTEVRETAGLFPATQTVTVRGLPVKLTTTVKWKDNRVHVAGQHPYASKVITVTASWTEQGVERTAPAQEALLTPSVSEVPPAGVVEVR